jgi:hypothetical protein
MDCRVHCTEPERSDRKLHQCLLKHYAESNGVQRAAGADAWRLRRIGNAIRQPQRDCIDPDIVRPTFFCPLLSCYKPSITKQVYATVVSLVTLGIIVSFFIAAACGFFGCPPPPASAESFNTGLLFLEPGPVVDHPSPQKRQKPTDALENAKAAPTLVGIQPELRILIFKELLLAPVCLGERPSQQIHTAIMRVCKKFAEEHEKPRSPLLSQNTIRLDLYIGEMDDTLRFFGQDWAIRLIPGYMPDSVRQKM